VDKTKRVELSRQYTHTPAVLAVINTVQATLKIFMMMMMMMMMMTITIKVLLKDFKATAILLQVVTD